MTPEQIAKGLTEAQACAVRSMQAYCDTDAPCRNARDLAIEMCGQYDATMAKMIAQDLCKLGLAECESGLVTVDGDFYGSGWLLSPLGLEVRAILEQQP